MLMLDVLILAILLLVPPAFLAKRFITGPVNQACAHAVILVGTTTTIALLLHYIGIPIRRDTLILAHAIYGGIVVIFNFTLLAPFSAYDYGRRLRITRRDASSPVIVARNRQPISHTKDTHPFLHGFVVGTNPLSPFKFRGLLYLLPIAMLIFPYTRFTGIDTYKWQDLATAIRLEQAIPWLIHPVGLFGFLPRSYPSLQPTLLASIQIMGNLGVDGGFRVLSLLTLWVAFSTSRCWFSRFLNHRDSTLCALAYVLMPVFVRYTHWATGRGLFLAIFPALLCLLTRSTDEPKAQYTTRATGIRWAGIILLGLLLVLSHKAAWIALPLLLISHLCQRIVPSRWAAKALLLVPILLVGVLMSHSAMIPGFPGKLIGASWILLARFAWIMPIATLAWLLAPKPPLLSHMPLAQFMLLPCLALAFDPQMYGALIALPFMVAFALPPVLQYTCCATSRYRQAAAIGLALLLVVSASAVVMQRSRGAATADVKAAALFLNTLNPAGPFQIHAPEAERTRIQAYVTGCPRFVLSGNPALNMTLPPLPSVTVRPIRQSVFAWTAWLRNIVTIEGLHVQWYGNPQTNYYFKIKGRGNVPAHAHPIYQNDSVTIYQ